MTKLLIISKALIALGCLPDYEAQPPYQAGTSNAIYFQPVGKTPGEEDIARADGYKKMAAEYLEDGKKKLKCEAKWREFKAAVDGKKLESPIELLSSSLKETGSGTLTCDCKSSFDEILQAISNVKDEITVHEVSSLARQVEIKAILQREL